MLAAALTLTACGGGRPAHQRLREPRGLRIRAGGRGEVVVGSANFPENVLLGEIYAQALEAKGVQVEKKFNIGSREVLYDQVKSGGLTVLPEYIGSLLAFVDKTTTAKTKEEIVAGLKEKLPAELEVLEPAAAEDNNSLTVTKETATKDGLTTIEDLAKVAKGYTVGGPPEFQSRQEENFKEPTAWSSRSGRRPATPPPTPSRTAPSRSATSSPPTRRSCSTTWSRCRTTRTPSPPTTSRPWSTRPASTTPCRRR